MSPRRCLICERLVPIVMRVEHVTREHPIIAATFMAENANLGVLFEDVRN